MNCRRNKPIFLLFALLLALALPVFGQQASPTPVTQQHLQIINSAFARNGVVNGRVEFDAYGRVELKGDYVDEPEVDRAFSLAQVVVGVKWVSPVTPENIQVKTWEKKLGNLFARANVLQPSVRGDGMPGPIRNRYAVVVGVGRFKYGIQPLEYAARDALAFYQFLTDPRRGQFRPDNVVFLTDENATRSNVAVALDKLRQLAGEDDLVTVYISSHGSPPDKKGAVNVVTYDTETKPRERIWYTSVTEDMLKEFVEGVKAKRLVMVLDTCYSNGAYRAVPGFLPPGGKSLGAGDSEGYGISQESSRRMLGGAKDLVLEDDTRRATTAKSVNIGSTEPYGKVLIGASGSGEQSWESEKLRNSIFTYYFVDGLNRYSGSVQQAFNYAKPRVASRVKEEKGHDIDQNPQAMATMPNWDMRLTQAATR
ncbi:MAG: caspase family protein [Comamonadaceae bacterium]|nr:caspase family protein [Comamonadaceae bacterium]